MSRSSANPRRSLNAIRTLVDSSSKPENERRPRLARRLALLAVMACAFALAGASAVVAAGRTPNVVLHFIEAPSQSVPAVVPTAPVEPPLSTPVALDDAQSRVSFRIITIQGFTPVVPGQVIYHPALIDFSGNIIGPATVEIQYSLSGQPFTLNEYADTNPGGPLSAFQKQGASARATAETVAGVDCLILRSATSGRVVHAEWKSNGAILAIDAVPAGLDLTTIAALIQHSQAA